jgi:hypothetical protein
MDILADKILSAPFSAIYGIITAGWQQAEEFSANNIDLSGEFYEI